MTSSLEQCTPGTALHPKLRGAPIVSTVTVAELERVLAALKTRGLAVSIRPRVPATNRSGMDTALDRGVYLSALVDTVGAILALAVPVTKVERYILRHLVSYYRNDDRVPLTADIVDQMATVEAA